MPHSPQSSKSRNQQTSSSIIKLRIAVAAVAFVIVLSLVFAFLWPGWAVKPAPAPVATPAATATAKPTIAAKALPDDATSLMKALPDHVAEYVRLDVATTDVWKDAKPLEAYAVTYGTSEEAKPDNSVSLTVAQWSTTADAQQQFAKLKSDLQGTEVMSGNIKVSGSTSGAYIMKTDGKPEDASAQATGLWCNDTVVFEVQGQQKAVKTMVELFPL
ncbi:hypothetical protein [Bifidobacterium gallicum]|uniref:Uncharacterized protein n=1 Tax=Bifidobacterium gallicum DSM 20093 = LMG 11596 TaxID=561180 RepID=D1NV96_9BIFI|nr:hypothetical protein [Bifidobacterium gallicum]EFA22747.1 hypothetical protein BIFGAL_03780 [Bifidobacterium gallicum DSM 20093 = LMG 11596]KFI59691.1 hypothetical protein BGLCM_0362 [Bifidobacterium gallicum DSM 20093 = LMG 11596]